MRLFLSNLTRKNKENPCAHFETCQNDKSQTRLIWQEGRQKRLPSLRNLLFSSEQSGNHSHIGAAGPDLVRFLAVPPPLKHVVARGLPGPPFSSVLETLHQFEQRSQYFTDSHGRTHLGTETFHATDMWAERAQSQDPKVSYKALGNLQQIDHF